MCAHPPVYKWGWGHTLHFYLDKYTVKMLLQVGQSQTNCYLHHFIRCEGNMLVWLCPT